MAAERTLGTTRLVLVDAPSNLGLRPPVPGGVPGCYKAPGALRDKGLLARLGAAEGGCVTPPRYDRGEWREGDGVFNAAAISTYSQKLADRIESFLIEGTFPVVLGGDCSILLGSTLALGRQGRFGLAFVDAHSDFRHPGNSDRIGAAAGEDLALVTGRGQPDLTDLEGRGPTVRDTDVAVLGIRPSDTARQELDGLGIPVWDSARLRSEGPAVIARRALNHLERADLDGFWVHVDVDVLDPSVMAEVDSPTPGGLDFPELADLLASLVGSPACVGMELTIYDPDLDPDGESAGRLADMLVSALAPSENGGSG